MYFSQQKVNTTQGEIKDLERIGYVQVELVKSNREPRCVAQFTILPLAFAA